MKGKLPVVFLDFLTHSLEDLNTWRPRPMLPHPMSWRWSRPRSRPLDLQEQWFLQTLMLYSPCQFLFSPKSVLRPRCTSPELDHKYCRLQILLCFSLLLHGMFQVLFPIHRAAGPRARSSPSGTWFQSPAPCSWGGYQWL